MKQGHVDFLIIGASPMASLLAGLLSTSHGKSVLLQGDANAGYRLPRGIDLSVAAITRPESWAVLTAAVVETTRLVSRIGKRAAISRLDPIFFAAQPRGRQALQHLRHMAQAYGVAAEPLPQTAPPAGRDGLLLRDAVMLRRAGLAPALDSWLNQSGVQRLAADAPCTLNPDGSADCQMDGQIVSIGQTILADDAALVRHLSDANWPALLLRRRASTIMTTPTDALAAPVMLDLDYGVTLRQHASGSVIADGPGEIAAFAGLLQRLLDQRQPLRHAGQTDYLKLASRDGAPAVGRIGGTGPDVLAGFGAIGAFMAPAIARWLSGAPSAAEAAWFGARLVNRAGQDGPVSDIGAGR